MQIAEEIRELIRVALRQLGLEVKKIELEHPADLTHGDYSSNVALRQIQGKQGGNPRELARAIGAELPKHKYIEKIEVAGAGFINFFLSRRFLIDSISEILTLGEQWGNGNFLDGKKVMIEYTDPNPFKELHIGHLVPNSIGVALARIVRAVGAEVREVTFQGDVGMHVAKAIYGMQKLGISETDEFTAIDLGNAYAIGATDFEKDDEAKSEIEKLNKRIYAIYSGEENELKKIYEKGKEVSIKYFEQIYALLGSDFKHYFFESESGPVGMRIVKENIGKVFEESQGAVIFKGEEYGLHTRVFINKEGLPTYEAKDVGLIQLKQNWWPHDISVTVTGSEQETYFNVVQKAVEVINPKMAKHMKLVVNGMLRLKNGKMSSRTGDVIRALDLIEDVRNVVSKKMQEADERNVTSVAIGAIKYSILKSATNKNIVFDFDSSISFEGDSGPYLQYTYARCCSILDKAKELTDYNFSDNLQITNIGIERLLYRFPSIVERSAYEYEPHYIANFLLELASGFNSWYAQEQILDGSPEQEYKLAITRAVSITIKNGLNLMGIKALNKM